MQEALKHGSFYTQEPFRTMLPQFFNSKSGPPRRRKKKDYFETLFQRKNRRKIISVKFIKICWQINTIATSWCSHSDAIYDVQLQQTLVLRTQPRHQATLTQPLQCGLQRLRCKTPKNYWTWKLKKRMRSCHKASLKKWNKWKMRKRSFRATLPSKCESGPCKKRSFRARLLSKIWKWKTWKQSFRRDFLQKRGNFKLTKRRLKRQLHCETSVKLKVSHAIALTCHCFDIPLLWFK